MDDSNKNSQEHLPLQATIDQLRDEIDEQLVKQSRNRSTYDLSNDDAPRTCYPEQLLKTYVTVATVLVAVVGVVLYMRR